MIIRVFLFFIFIFNITLFAHSVPGMDITIEKKEQNQILIKAFFKKSKKPLVGNEVKLISKFDNRILEKDKLTAKGLTLKIPDESYWVYVIVRDNDLVKDGIAPDGGFKKQIEIKKVAFLYTTIATLFFIILSTSIGYKRNKLFRNKYI